MISFYFLWQVYWNFFFFSAKINTNVLPVEGNYWFPAVRSLWTLHCSLIWFNERSGCLYNTCVILVFLFFPPTIQNSIYTFLKPDKIRSIFPLGRMDKNHFHMWSNCLLLSNPHKGVIFTYENISYSMISIKQATALPMFTKSRFTSKVLIFT